MLHLDSSLAPSGTFSANDNSQLGAQYSCIGLLRVIIIVRTGLKNLGLWPPMNEFWIVSSDS